MFVISPTMRVHLCTTPADMRRSFDGLAAMTEHVLRKNPLSGHLFVFRNRRCDRVKILYFDRSGYCLWYKRLERGTFRFPSRPEEGVEIDMTELAMLLEGIELEGVKRRERFSLPASATVARDSTTGAMALVRPS